MLAGRRELVDDIHAIATLVSPGGKSRALRPVEIVQLTGPPFSGKTELLVALADRYGAVAPVGWHDFANDRPGSADHEILNLLAFLMSGPRGEFGRLAFPRLLSTLIAMKQDAGADRDEAIRIVTHALTGPGSTERIRNAVTALAADATRLAEHAPRSPFPRGHIPGSGTNQLLTPEVVLTAIRRPGAGRRMPLPLAKNGLERWPGMTTPESIYETLADINFHLANNDPRIRATGAAQPWAAFLSDVSSGYGRPFRNLCALLVLDNVDHPAGRQFLWNLAEACAERRRHLEGQVDAVPLLVICGGRQPVDVGGRWQIQHRELPSMTAEEVSELAVKTAINAPAAAEGAIYAISGGHTGTVQAMLSYCAAQPSYPYDLAPGVDVRRHLLPGVSDAEFEALVTCSPAIDVTQVEHIIYEKNQPGEDLSAIPGFGMRSMLSHLGWLSGPEINKCVRNLLLRQLALRPEDHEWSWPRACQRLRGYPPELIPNVDLGSHPMANSAYYYLAGGDVAEALRILDRIRTNAPLWLAMFDWIITAPHHHSMRDDPWPLAQRISSAANQALTDTGVRPELIRLVVACWLAADGQLDPWHQLDQHIARGYEDVAPLIGGDEFLRRAMKYREQAQWWHHSGLDRHPRPAADKPAHAVKEGAL